MQGQVSFLPFRFPKAASPHLSPVLQETQRSPRVPAHTLWQGVLWRKPGVFLRFEHHLRLWEPNMSRVGHAAGIITNRALKFIHRICSNQEGSFPQGTEISALKSCRNRSGALRAQFSETLGLWALAAQAQRRGTLVMPRYEVFTTVCLYLVLVKGKSQVYAIKNSFLKRELKKKVLDL